MQRGAEKQEGRRGEREPQTVKETKTGAPPCLEGCCPARPASDSWAQCRLRLAFIGPGSCAPHAVAGKDPPEFSCLWPSAQQDPEAGSSVRLALRARTMQRETMDSKCLWEVNKWLNLSHWDAGVIYYLGLTCLFWLSVAVWIVARHSTALIAIFPK